MLTCKTYEPVNHLQPLIPSTVMVTPYRRDVVIHNTATSSIVQLELTCPLDSGRHLQSARLHKQCKVEHLQLST